MRQVLDENQRGLHAHRSPPQLHLDEVELLGPGLTQRLQTADLLGRVRIAEGVSEEVGLMGPLQGTDTPRRR